MADSNYEKVFRQYQEWFLQDNPRGNSRLSGVENRQRVSLYSLLWRIVYHYLERRKY